MSHISVMSTTITSPDRVLLRQAVEVVANQLAGGKVRDYYLTYRRQRRKATLAIADDTMYRGMAIQVNEGKLAFVGDNYGCEEHYEEVQQQIVQTYVSLATMRALEALGYQTSVEDGQAGQVVLTGVSYA
jgi:hypothetical protein